MSRIIDYKIGREFRDDEGQFWVSFRYWFRGGSTHEQGPVAVDSRADALQKCKDTRQLIDSCFRKQDPDCPPRPPVSAEDRARLLAEKEDV